MSFCTRSISACGTIVTTSRPTTLPPRTNSTQRSADLVWPLASGPSPAARSAEPDRFPREAACRQLSPPCPDSPIRAPASPAGTVGSGAVVGCALGAVCPPAAAGCCACAVARAERGREGCYKNQLLHHVTFLRKRLSSSQLNYTEPASKRRCHGWGTGELQELQDCRIAEWRIGLNCPESVMPRNPAIASGASGPAKGRGRAPGDRHAFSHEQRRA